ncbi:hypothetical protein Tco_0083083 [Tanacetum coccineum]
MSFFLLTRSAWLMLKCSEILDICPRVQGVDYAEVPDDKNTLTFLIDLGYKGLLYKHPSMYVDHMHQPWRTLAAIINQCFSGKTTSNDKLRKSRIDILWDDGIVSRLKLVIIGEDFQEYGLPIPETMLTEGIKQSKSYQMFIICSTGLIPPKKSRGKGSQGKKAVVSLKPISDEESDVSDAKPARKCVGNP